jgi:hypothetical protein
LTNGNCHAEEIDAMDASRALLDTPATQENYTIPLLAGSRQRISFAGQAGQSFISPRHCDTRVFAFFSLTIASRAEGSRFFE